MPREPLERREFLAAGGAALLGGAAGRADVPSVEETAEMPGTALEDLERAVAAVIAARRIGQPVFVRFLLHGAARSREVPARLARMTQAVRAWMGQPLEHLYAVGSAEDGQVTLTLQFGKGGTGLVSFARGRGRGDGADLTVIGNHGAISYDAGTGPLWDAAATFRDGPADARLLDAVRRALRSGRPEALQDGQP